MNQYRERQKKLAAKRRELILSRISAGETLEKIGKFLGISKQRVGQLAADARKRLERA